MRRRRAGARIAEELRSLDPKSLERVMRALVRGKDEDDDRRQHLPVADDGDSKLK